MFRFFSKCSNIISVTSSPFLLYRHVEIISRVLAEAVFASALLTQVCQLGRYGRDFEMPSC